ncbi:hypothetical protein BJV78DRAFT_1230925 [Lactifluus subvellereus]|nr:hypothetical protein BJV78DRAFT_1230925 [Lactifluus subvellereus]
MAHLFSIPVFFSLSSWDPRSEHHPLRSPRSRRADWENISSQELSGNEDDPQTKRLIRKMRFQIFAGSALGFLIAAIIGAAFLAVWFTKVSNLGIGSFNLIASLIIFVMGINMLKLVRAKTRWHVKLQRAFEGQREIHPSPCASVLIATASIPIAAIVGIICGPICGLVVYTFSSRSTLSVFLVVMTNFIPLIDSGLFSKAVKSFQSYEFNRLLGAHADCLSRDGPGTFDVRGNVWHLDCRNTENYLDCKSCLLSGTLFGWTNSATRRPWHVLSYVFYWIAVIITLVVLKWREGRISVFGLESSVAQPAAVPADTSGIHEKISELPK